ncbi:MAG: cation diffusion facilitator family transporter, partial [Bacilli bacterium]
MSNNFKQIRRTLSIILIFNVVVSLTKIILGTYTNTSSIFADGVHSMSDGLNNVVGIVGLSYAYAPADDNHPYGHKKIETILSLFIAFLLFVMAYNLFMQNISNFNN